jgi:uncharacterized protein (DUF2344 family)
MEEDTLMIRMRMKFRKVGVVRFSSHRDVFRMIQRSLAACEAPLSYTQGYHPHPRISFGPALRTGWEGLGEYFDIHLEQPMEHIEERLSRMLPQGVDILEAVMIEKGIPKLNVDISAAHYQAEMQAEDLSEMWEGRKQKEHSIRQQSLGNLLGEKDSQIEIPDDSVKHFLAMEAGEAGSFSLTVKDLTFKVQEGVVTAEYLSSMHQGKSYLPETLAASLVGDADRLETRIKVKRTELFIERNGVFLSPIEGVVN